MQERLTHRERLDRRPFVVGLFFPTMTGGWIMSRAAWEKRREQWRWTYLSQLARRADALDLDYLFMGMAYPHYGGFGGSIDFRAHRMESISTAAAVAAITERIFICPTVHILYHLHPIFLAHLATTIDHVSNGRFGMNIVAGFSPYEQALLDVPALAHDERYEAADEFVTILRRAWTEGEPFDYQGRYYRSQRAWVSPKPLQRPYPLLVNAGLSEAGRNFAARVCDWSFINPPNARDIASARPLCADLKARAARYGRTLRLSTQAIVVCKETDAEAEAYYQWIVDNAADDAVAAWQEQSRQAVALGLTQDTSRFASERAKGEGRIFASGVVVVGSPATVTERLIEIRDVGIDGVHLGFLDYDELDFFAARVLPLLREAGLR